MADTPPRMQASEDARKANLPSGDWVLDPSTSRAVFRARGFWGLTPVEGRFAEPRGNLSIDTAGRASLSLHVEAEGLATGIGLRDHHLRGPDFLDAQTHPTITFTADRTRWTEAGITAAGQLTVRGQPVTLEVPVELVRDGADLIARAECTVDVHMFGMRRRLGMVRPQVRLTIEGRLVRAET